MPIRELRTTLRSVALPFSSSGDRPRRWDFNPLDITPLRGVFFRCPVCLSFFLSLQGTRRVKQRSFNLHLLVKPNEPISGIRLSSGISHIRKQMYRIDTSARFGLQQLFDNLHDLCQMEFSLTFFGGLPFWYLIIRLLLSCCQPLLYPDQNPFAGSGFPFHTVASCTLRHRFCISSACPSSLLWVHPTPLNALLLLSHSGYTSATFAPSVEFIDPETSWVLTQPQGGR